MYRDIWNLIPTTMILAPTFPTTKDYGLEMILKHVTFHVWWYAPAPMTKSNRAHCKSSVTHRLDRRYNNSNTNNTKYNYLAPKVQPFWVAIYFLECGEVSVKPIECCQISKQLSRGCTWRACSSGSQSHVLPPKLQKPKLGNWYGLSSPSTRPNDDYGSL